LLLEAEAVVELLLLLVDDGRAIAYIEACREFDSAIVRHSEGAVILFFFLNGSPSKRIPT
jgi:hypothetical protein